MEKQIYINCYNIYSNYLSPSQGITVVPAGSINIYNIVNNLQRDGCPKIVNLGSARMDMFYERKKYGFKKR